MRLLNEHINYCRKEKSGCQNDGSVKEDFFKAPFGAVNVSLAAEGGGKAGAALLQQNCRYQ